MGWGRDGLKKLNYWKTSFSKAINKWLKIVLGYLAHTTGQRNGLKQMHLEYNTEDWASYVSVVLACFRRTHQSYSNTY